MRRLTWALLSGLGLAAVSAQENPPRPPQDAVAQAQQPSAVANKRPEQTKNAHDRSGAFDAGNAKASSPIFKSQPKEGKISGFDFYRDPFCSDKPLQNPDEIVKKLTDDKPRVMAAQRELLERRYNLAPRFDPEAKMSRGKPLAVGPTARLARGMTWDRIAQLRPEEIKQQDVFPYPALPHPLQTNGGQVFPKMQIDMFPRLERFDVDFDLPEGFLPEFPPAIFLSNRGLHQ